MSKKKEDTEQVFYGLNTKAVEDLVDANTENTPKYSQEELNKYTKKKFSIPSSVKSILIKYWFNGMVCFFFFWGLGIYIPNQLDLFFVFCLGMGFVTDLLVNNILRFIEKNKGENNKWIMFTKKGFSSLVFNVFYSFLVMGFVFVFYNMINLLINKITGNTDTVAFGVEPFSFGLVYLAFDLMFIGLKHLGSRIIADAKAKAYRGV